MKKFLQVTVLSFFIIVGVAMVILYNIGDRMLEEAITNELVQRVQQEILTTDDKLSKEENKVIQDVNGNDVGSSKNNDRNANGVSSNNQGVDSTVDDNGKEIKVKTEVKKTTKTDIPIEKISEVKDKVTAKDKLTAAKLVFDKLSTDDVNYLKDMLIGGLDKQEKKKAAELAYSRFTPSEISEIKMLYKKYMN